MARGTVTAEVSVHLHSEPGGDETIIGSLKRGAPLHVLGSEQRPQRLWLHVMEFAGEQREGWIDSRFVKVEGELPLPTSRPDRPSPSMDPMTKVGITTAVLALLGAIVWRFLG